MEPTLEDLAKENLKLAVEITALNKRLVEYQCQISRLKIELENTHTQDAINGCKTFQPNDWLELMAEVRTATPERLKTLLEAARVKRLIRINEMKKAVEELAQSEENLMMCHMEIVEISHQFIRQVNQ